MANIAKVRKSERVQVILSPDELALLEQAALVEITDAGKPLRAAVVYRAALLDWAAKRVAGHQAAGK